MKAVIAIIFVIFLQIQLFYCIENKGLFFQPFFDWETTFVEALFEILLVLRVRCSAKLGALLGVLVF